MWTLKNSRKPQNIFGGLFGGGAAAPGNPSAGPAIGSTQTAANPQGQPAAGTQAATTPDPQEGLNSLAKLWAAPSEAAKAAAAAGTRCRSAGA